MDGKKTILNLLEKGAITAEEAERFLKIYDSYEETKARDVNHAFKRLYIKVTKEEKQKVLVNIPLEFLGLLKTSKVKHKIESFDIDLDKVIEMASSGFTGTIIEVMSSDNVLIHVYVE